jgi:hypothetical protein
MWWRIPASIIFTILALTTGNPIWVVGVVITLSPLLREKE